MLEVEGMGMWAKAEASLAGMEAPAYAALRMVAGAMFSLHGAQKILGWFTTRTPPEVFTQSWVGGWIELVGGMLVALGLFTRGAAFLCSGTMAVAYVQFHWKLQVFEAQWNPLVNKGELALLYCFVFAFIAARGSGIAALDRRR